jgi:hypothetical protein
MINKHLITCFKNNVNINNNLLYMLPQVSITIPIR